MEMNGIGRACRIAKMIGRLVGNPEAKRQVARRRRIYENNINMYLQEV
jgi:hypothetical protein